MNSLVAVAAPLVLHVSIIDCTTAQIEDATEVQYNSIYIALYMYMSIFVKLANGFYLDNHQFAVYPDFSVQFSLEI